MNVLLSGIVGSVAYGLAGPDSDIDRLGIFAVPTDDLFDLHPPKMTYSTSKPDVTHHEVSKWCLLALGCNPTITELVWLPENLYETVTELGYELITIRRSFLSAQRVRNAYLGYATQQFRKIVAGRSKPSERDRMAKHARHLLRLCSQGLTLYETGSVEIRLTEPERFIAFGQRVAEGDVDTVARVLHDYETKFDRARTPLAERPDEERVARWVRAVRRTFLEAAPSCSCHNAATRHAYALANGSRAYC